MISEQLSLPYVIERPSTITPEEVDAILKRSFEEIRELRQTLEEVFSLPPTARTQVLR